MNEYGDGLNKLLIEVLSIIRKIQESYKSSDLDRTAIMIESVISQDEQFSKKLDDEHICCCDTDQLMALLKSKINIISMRDLSPDVFEIISSLRKVVSDYLDSVLSQHRNKFYVTEIVDDEVDDKPIILEMKVYSRRPSPPKFIPSLVIEGSLDSGEQQYNKCDQTWSESLASGCECAGVTSKNSGRDIKIDHNYDLYKDCNEYSRLSRMVSKYFSLDVGGYSSKLETTLLISSLPKSRFDKELFTLLSREKRDKESEHCLGIVYYCGVGVRRDIEKAYIHFRNSGLTNISTVMATLRIVDHPEDIDENLDERLKISRTYLSKLHECIVVDDDHALDCHVDDVLSRLTGSYACEREMILKCICAMAMQCTESRRQHIVEMLNNNCLLTQFEKERMEYQLSYRSSQKHIMPYSSFFGHDLVHADTIMRHIASRRAESGYAVEFLSNFIVGDQAMQGYERFVYLERVRNLADTFPEFMVARVCFTE